MEEGELTEPKNFSPSISDIGNLTDESFLPETFDLPKEFKSTKNCEVCDKSFGFSTLRHYW